jgi:hypothetical protein
MVYTIPLVWYIPKEIMPGGKTEDQPELRKFDAGRQEESSGEIESNYKDTHFSCVYIIKYLPLRPLFEQSCHVSCI